MDEFLSARLVAVRTFYLALRSIFPGARRRLESCTPHVLSGQREQIPLCKTPVSNTIPLRRREPPEGYLSVLPDAAPHGRSISGMEMLSVPWASNSAM